MKQNTNNCVSLRGPVPPFFPVPDRADGKPCAKDWTLSGAKREGRDLKRRVASVAQLAADAFHATYGGEVVATFTGDIPGCPQTGAKLKAYAPVAGSTSAMGEASAAYAALLEDLMGASCRIVTKTVTDDQGLVHGQLIAFGTDGKPLPASAPSLLIVRSTTATSPKRCRDTAAGRPDPAIAAGCP